MSASFPLRLAIALLLLAVPATAGAQQRPRLAEQMAKAYGLDGFGRIESIRYTWNAEFAGLSLSHQWQWSPKTDTVTYEGKTKDGQQVKVTYQRAQLGSEPAVVQNEIDPAFVNDQYWLVFPFHVIWDSSATVTDDGKQPLPSGQGSATRIVVKYPSDGGYEPGDTWDLYLGPDKRVVEFVYHRGGSKPPKLVTATWKAYRKAGPLLFSSDHVGTADGKPLRIFISDVSVKLAGSKNWINAR